jgi:hypothetical protein
MPSGDFYSEFQIGQRWERKRGRHSSRSNGAVGEPDMPAALVIRNVYRPDGQVLVRWEPAQVKPQATLRVRDLRRNYKPTMERIVG